jgi:hypothetical protein
VSKVRQAQAQTGNGEVEQHAGSPMNWADFFLGAIVGGGAIAVVDAIFILWYLRQLDK